MPEDKNPEAATTFLGGVDVGSISPTRFAENQGSIVEIKDWNLLEHNSPIAHTGFLLMLSFSKFNDSRNQFPKMILIDFHMLCVFAVLKNKNTVTAFIKLQVFNSMEIQSHYFIQNKQ